MKCRRLKTWYDELGRRHRDVVWFGSYGVDDDKAKFYNEEDKHDNYSEKQEAIVDSLTQRLSVIKKELWYNQNYGIPLFEKIKSKGIMDSYIISTIVQLPEVIRIVNFSSNVENNKYSCYADIITEYGNVQLNF